MTQIRSGRRGKEKQDGTERQVATRVAVQGADGNLTGTAVACASKVYKCVVHTAQGGQVMGELSGRFL